VIEFPIHHEIAKIRKHETENFAMTPTEQFTIRTDLRPGDIGTIISLHGTVYAHEHGFDSTFEAYVAEPLAQFVKANSTRQQLWIAERDGHIVGCIAIVPVSETIAQLRWYLVEPNSRGLGLGRRLLDDAISFSHQSGYSHIILWTEGSLLAAARMYERTGFRKTESKPGHLWGLNVVEEKYELRL